MKKRAWSWFFRRVVADVGMDSDANLFWHADFWVDGFWVDNFWAES